MFPQILPLKTDSVVIKVLLMASQKVQLKSKTIAWVRLLRKQTQWYFKLLFGSKHGFGLN